MSSTKPPLPTLLANHWQRIPVDLTDPETAWILKLAVSGADGWALGPHGPLHDRGMTLAEITSGAVREALLHLLELGLIDIDTDRLRTAYAFPLRREPEEPRP
ncbi:hypothetical protein [Streptomyces goshikiensis]|uniref:hypothetical protein n=1 Tax=Streptomyces goshikiensis TaxID=1942 RepID=UPI00368D5915